MNIFNRYHFFFGLTAATLLFSCKGNEDVEPTQYIGADKISRIELSPNAPVLNADGVSRLDFKVSCYYKVGEKEYPFLSDRLPFDKVLITPSEGKPFKLSDGYTTTSTAQSVSFRANIGEATSSEVSVSLRNDPLPQWKTLRYPISFRALYTERSKPYTVNITRAFLEQMIKRINDVFAGRLTPTPNGCDTKIEFYFQDLELVQMTKEENENLYKSIQEKAIDGADKAIRVWITYGLSGRYTTNIAPGYTTGEASAIPGLKLKKVNSASELKLKDLKLEQIGIPISYNSIYKNAIGITENRIEQLLGRYFGLLSTRSFKKESTQDADYCPDTFSYADQLNSTSKRTITYGGSQYLYDSFNIMDSSSATLSISRDQAIRIRQVIQDCPFRNQGKEVSPAP